MTTPVTSLEIDIVDSLQTTLDKIFAFLPNLLGFLVVLFIFWIIAKVVAKGLGMLLQKLGFSKLLDKAGANDLLRNAQIDPVGLITKLVYYFILLIGLQLALTNFGPSNPVSDIVNDIVAFLPKAVVAIVIIIIVAAIANAVGDLLAASLGGLSFGDLLTKIVKGFIIALGVIAALGQVGIAANVTNGLMTFVFATIGGILVVGVGGGLIQPMRSRWEGWLGSLENEARGAGSSSGSHASPPPAGQEPGAPGGGQQI